MGMSPPSMERTGPRRGDHERPLRDAQPLRSIGDGSLGCEHPPRAFTGDPHAEAIAGLVTGPRGLC